MRRVIGALALAAVAVGAYVATARALRPKRPVWQFHPGVKLTLRPVVKHEWVTA